MSQNKKATDIYAIIFTIIFISITLSSVIAIRELKGMPIYLNGESYYNLRIAKDLVADPLLEEDPIQGNTYSPQIYHYFISVSIIFLGLGMTTYLIPILLGIMSALFFFRALLNMGLPKVNAGFSAMLLSVSPAFIYVFSNLSNFGLVAFLSIIATSFYFEKNYWDFPWKISGKIYFFISIIALCALGITSLLGYAITILLILVLSIFEGRSLKSYLFASFPSILAVITMGTFTDFFQKQVSSLGFQIFNIRNVFSIFGAEMGLDFFLTVLFLTGLMVVWGYFKSLRVFHLLAIAFVIISFFNPLLRLYASMIISVYCVVAIKHIYYNKWELEIIKTGTVILLICALVFSSISEISQLISAEPGADAEQVISALTNLEPGVVLGQEDFGYFIQETGHKTTLLDIGMVGNENYQDTLGDYNYILTLVRLNEASSMLNKHKIRYIFLTPQMKDEVWSGKEKEFLLLIKNSDKFKLIYEKGGFEIWEYLDERSI